MSKSALVEQVDIVDQLLEDWAIARPDLDASAMAIVGRVIMLGKLFEEAANRELADFGLALWGLDVLATLRRVGAPYRLTPTELRKWTLLSSGAMTNRLDRLEQEGLLTRTHSATDRRSIDITLTPKGKKLIDRAIKPRFRVAAADIDALTTEQRSQLTELLKTLTTAAGSD